MTLDATPAGSALLGEHVALAVSSDCPQSPIAYDLVAHTAGGASYVLATGNITGTFDWATGDFAADITSIEAIAYVDPSSPLATTQLPYTLTDTGLQNGLVLDLANGDGTDFSGVGGDLGASNGGGTPAVDRFGRTASATQYDFGGFVGTPNVPQGNAPRTLAAWVQLSDPGVDVILGQGNGCGGGELALYTNALVFGTTSCNFFADENGALGNGTWSHVAVTYDGTTGKMYVDGSLVSTVDLSFLYTSNEFWLATRLVNGQNQLHGALDDVRVYDRALSDSEVAALAKVDLPPPPSAASASCTQVSVNAAPRVPLGTTVSVGLGSNCAVPEVEYELTVVGPSGQTWTLRPFSTQATFSWPTADLAPGVYQVAASAHLPGQPLFATATTNVSVEDVSSLAQGLVLHLANGDGTDSSGVGGDLAPVNGGATPTADRFGRAGLASLYQSGGYLGTPSGVPQGNAARTLSAWVLTSDTGIDTFIGQGTGCGGGELDLFSEGLVLGTTSCNFFANEAGSIGNGTWTQVAFTFDGTTGSMFVNGAMVRSDDLSFLSTTGELWVGYRLVNGQDQLKGALDDVRVYDRVLTPTELDQLANLDL